MKPKIRRIIAREGLILISVMLLAGVSYCLDLWIMNQKSLYEANVKEIQPGHPRKIIDPFAVAPQDSAGVFWKLSGKILQFPKHTSDDVIKQTIRRDVPNIEVDDYFIFDSPQGRNIGASYNDKGQLVFNSIMHKISFSYVSIFFLVFAYPLYLLGRFVVWAIVTLKGKVEN